MEKLCNTMESMQASIYAFYEILFESLKIRCFTTTKYLTKIVNYKLIIFTTVKLLIESFVVFLILRFYLKSLQVYKHFGNVEIDFSRLLFDSNVISKNREISKILCTFRCVRGAIPIVRSRFKLCCTRDIFPRKQQQDIFQYLNQSRRLASNSILEFEREKLLNLRCLDSKKDGNFCLVTWSVSSNDFANVRA